MKTQHEQFAHVVWGEYRWRSTSPADTSINDGTLEEAAEAMKLDPDEVAWAIEEYGRCDTQFADEPGEGIVCWRPSEPVIDGPDDDQVSGGWEWPAAEAPSEE